MTPYELLGVTPNTSPQDVKRAYRKLAQKHHPDNGGDYNTFQELAEAYESILAGTATHVTKIVRRTLTHVGLFKFGFNA